MAPFIPGVLRGSWDKREYIRDTILKEGEEFGIVEVGAAAYCSSGIESGWIQGVLPAIYTGESTEGYRKSLTTMDLEVTNRLTGSYLRNNIEDYYRTPADLGYGRFVHFEHEFIGRDALRAMGDRPKLQKVTLAWNPDDTAELLKQMVLPEGKNVKMLHLPIANDKTEVNYDRMTFQGKDAGCAHYSAYLATERAMLTLSLVDESLKMGDEVEIHWGELGGGFGNYVAPGTDLMPIRAIVSPAPYSRVAREEYRIPVTA